MNTSDPDCALHYALNTRVAPRVAGVKDTRDPAAITRAAKHFPLGFCIPARPEPRLCYIL